MNLDDLTLGDIKKLQTLFNSEGNIKDQGLNYHVGKKVIIRTYSAGVWFGKLVEKSGNEVILADARRIYTYYCKKSISLSGVATYGVMSKSKICPAIHKQWLEAIEIIEMTDIAIKSLEAQPDVEAT